VVEDRRTINYKEGSGVLSGDEHLSKGKHVKSIRLFIKMRRKRPIFIRGGWHCLAVYQVDSVGESSSMGRN